MNNIEFIEETHTYKIDDIEYPSVNQGLSLVGTRKNRDDYWCSISGSEFIINNGALEFGSGMHALIAEILRGKKVKYNYELKPYIESYESFYEKYPNLEVYRNMIEEPLGNIDLGYCGTPDVIMIDKKTDVCYVVDWKTGKSKQKTWGLQMGAYYGLLPQSNVRAVCVRIRNGKKCLIDEYTKEQLDVYFKTWLCVLGTLNYTKKKKAKNDKKKK